MKKVLRIIWIVFLVLLLLFGLLFYYWKNRKLNKELYNYEIKEKLIIKFYDDDDKYLIDLNNLSYKKYDWKYKEYCYDFENYPPSEKNTKIHNKDGSFYIFYKKGVFYRNKIYHINDIVAYNFIPWHYQEAYWSKNWDYLITRGRFVRMMLFFWLFLPKETTTISLNIVEPSTWKNKQLPILWHDVEKILWYVDKELEENPDIDLEWKEFCTSWEIINK